MAKAAGRSPEEPWLFFREGLDWRWRSYARVADQVARALGALREALLARSTEPQAIDIASDIPPEDRIAAILAAQCSGHATRWPAGPEPDDLALGHPDFPVPPCRGMLDTRDRLLELQPVESGAGGVVVSGSNGDFLWAAQDLEAQASSLIRESDRSPLSDGHVRPILFAQAELLRSPVMVSILISLSLQLRSAWTLEPHPEAFVATILWARPSLLVTQASGADAVCAALGSNGAKSDRKQSRLRRLVVCEPRNPGDEARARWKEELNVEVDWWCLEQTGVAPRGMG